MNSSSNEAESANFVEITENLLNPLAPTTPLVFHSHLQAKQDSSGAKIPKQNQKKRQKFRTDFKITTNDRKLIEAQQSESKTKERIKNY